MLIGVTSWIELTHKLDTLTPSVAALTQLKQMLQHPFELFCKAKSATC